MSQSSDIQPQEVGGVEEIVLGCNFHEVCFLIPNHVEVSVVADPLLWVFPLLLGPLLLCQETVGQRLESKGTDIYFSPSISFT